METKPKETLHLRKRQLTTQIQFCRYEEGASDNHIAYLKNV